MRTYKLGKHAPRYDKRTLRMSNYVTTELPPPPGAVDWTPAVESWPMYANDRYGCCTCAAAGHMIDGWRENAGEDRHVLTDLAILDAYAAVTGFNPNAPLLPNGQNPTDNGACALDVLKHWRNVGIGGHRIGAWVDGRPANQTEVKQSIWLFGAAYVGMSLPDAIFNTPDGDPMAATWDVPLSGCVGDWRPNPRNGHMISLHAYDLAGWLKCVTWAGVKLLSWRFLEAYCDELHAVLSQDLLNADMLSPTGLNLDQLRADLAAL